MKRNVSDMLISRIFCDPSGIVGESADETDLYPPRVVIRFESRVDRSGGPDACHPWTRGTNRYGYGWFFPEPKRGVHAHRFALEVHLGRRLGRHEVARHADCCTTRACCNPRHLSPGSHADNMADMVRVGRSVKGERQWAAKLTPDKVREIRRRCAAGESKASVARSLGVSRPTVSYVASGLAWKCVPVARLAVSQ